MVAELKVKHEQEEGRTKKYQEKLGSNQDLFQGKMEEFQSMKTKYEQTILKLKEMLKERDGVMKKLLENNSTINTDFRESLIKQTQDSSRLEMDL